MRVLSLSLLFSACCLTSALRQQQKEEIASEEQFKSKFAALGVKLTKLEAEAKQVSEKASTVAKNAAQKAVDLSDRDEKKWAKAVQDAEIAKEKSEDLGTFVTAISTLKEMASSAFAESKKVVAVVKEKVNNVMFKPVLVMNKVVTGKTEKAETKKDTKKVVSAKKKEVKAEEVHAGEKKKKVVPQNGGKKQDITPAKKEDITPAKKQDITPAAVRTVEVKEKAGSEEAQKSQVETVEVKKVTSSKKEKKKETKVAVEKKVAAKHVEKQGGGGADGVAQANAAADEAARKLAEEKAKAAELAKEKARQAQQATAATETALDSAATADQLTKVANNMGGFNLRAKEKVKPKQEESRQVHLQNIKEREDVKKAKTVASSIKKNLIISKKKKNVDSSISAKKSAESSKTAPASAKQQQKVAAVLKKEVENGAGKLRLKSLKKKVEDAKVEDEKTEILHRAPTMQSLLAAEATEQEDAEGLSADRLDLLHTRRVADKLYGATVAVGGEEFTNDASSKRNFLRDVLTPGLESAANFLFVEPFSSYKEEDAKPEAPPMQNSEAVNRAVSIEANKRVDLSDVFADYESEDEKRIAQQARDALRLHVAAQKPVPEVGNPVAEDRKKATHHVHEVFAKLEKMDSAINDRLLSSMNVGPADYANLRHVEDASMLALETVVDKPKVSFE